MRTHRLAAVVAIAAVSTIAAAVFTGSSPAPATAQESAHVQRPAVIAVKLHADWCGSCKAMGPTYVDLSNKLDTASALFLTLDFTNESDRRQAAYHVAALGLEGAMSEWRNKTGVVLLIDYDTRRVVDVLTKDDGVKAMASKLEAAIRAAG